MKARDYHAKTIIGDEVLVEVERVQCKVENI